MELNPQHGISPPRAQCARKTNLGLHPAGPFLYLLGLLGKKRRGTGEVPRLPSPVIPVDRITGCEEIGFSSRRPKSVSGQCRTRSEVMAHNPEGPIEICGNVFSYTGFGLTPA
jgi:hypothetical protein